MFLFVDVESWGVVTVWLDANDLVFTLVLANNNDEFFLLVVGLTDENGKLFAFILIDIFFRAGSDC